MSSKKLVPEVVDVVAQLKKEFSERMFARMCQLLESNGCILTIDEDIFDDLFDTISEELDDLEVSDNKEEDGDYIPYFIDDELLIKLKILRAVERFVGEEATPVSDIVGAVINPTLCLNKSIDIREDADNKLVVISLLSEEIEAEI